MAKLAILKLVARLHKVTCKPLRVWGGVCFLFLLCWFHVPHLNHTQKAHF